MMHLTHHLGFSLPAHCVSISVNLIKTINKNLFRSKNNENGRLQSMVLTMSKVIFQPIPALVTKPSPALASHQKQLFSTGPTKQPPEPTIPLTGELALLLAQPI